MNLSTEEFIELAKGSAPYEPCVGSGYCCKKAPCIVASKRIENWSAPCPALRWSEPDDRYFCGFVLDAESETEKKSLKGFLFIGEGCCSPLSTEHREAIKPYLKDERVQDLIGLDRREAYMEELHSRLTPWSPEDYRCQHVTDEQDVFELLLTLNAKEIDGNQG